MQPPKEQLVDLDLDRASALANDEAFPELAVVLGPIVALGTQVGRSLIRHYWKEPK